MECCDYAHANRRFTDAEVPNGDQDMTRERLRAIALAAIMLVSMVAVGVGGLAGSAVAQEAGQGEVVVLDQDGNQIENGPYDTVQTAVNNAKDGYTVAVGSGTYEETVVITGVNDVTITAADGAEPVIEGEVRIGDPSDPVGADGTILRGLTIVDPDDSENFDDNNRGVGLTSSDDVVINDVTFEGFKTQVSLDFAGKTPTNVTLTENTFRDGFAAIGSTENVGELTIENNTFDNVVEGVGLGGGVDLTVGTVSALIDANTYRNIDTETQYAVGDYRGDELVKYSPNGNILVQGGDSIQSAVDAAAKDSTIEINSGNYEEQVFINKEINITGTDDPVIQAPESTKSVTFAESGNKWEPVVYINDSKVSISGLTIDGQNRIPTDRSTGVLVHNATAKVRGLTVRNMSIGNKETFGVSVFGNSDAEIKNNHITEYARGGISVNGDKGPLADPTATVVNNTVIGPGKDEDVTWAPNGIQVGFGATGEVRENEVSGNGWPGPEWAGSGILIYNADAGVNRNHVHHNEVGVFLVGSDSSSLEDNTFNNNTYHASLDSASPSVISRNDFSTATYVNEPSVVYGSISGAVGAADPGDTVSAHSGLYSEKLSIETANVTLSGKGDPVVDGRIDIRSDEVTVQDLTVQNGAPSGSSEVEGIFVGNSSGFDDKDGKVTIQNVTVEDIHPQGTSKTVEGIHVKHYDSGENIDGLEMINVTIQNVTGPSDAFPKKGANGVKLQAGIRDITIEGSTIDDVEGNYAFGVTSTWSSRESGSPTDVSVSETRISNITPGIGFHVAANGEDDNADQFADPTDITVEQNEFVDNTFDIYNGNTSGTLQAPLNYYGEDADPLVGGNVIYDPLLTTSIDQVNTEERGEIRNYGSYIELNSSGDAVAVGFSAAPDGNASEIFSDLDIEGNAFTYDNDDGYVEVEPDDTFSAGDVVVVTNNGVDEDMIVPIDTSVENEAAQPTSVDVENGWNLVATGAANDVSGITAALGGTGSIADSAVLQTQAKQPGAPPARFGAYGGTWIFVDGSGEISTGYAEDQSPTEYYTELLLTDQTRIDSGDEDGDS